MALVASQELILELRICFLSFDRAGYRKISCIDMALASRCSSCGSNCQLLVAFLSSSSIQGGLQETTSARPMETSDCPLHSWTTILVDEPEMVPMIIFFYVETMIRQQGVVESLHRDLMVGFGNWEFDPMELSNPFPNNESFVHICQGFEDPLVPVKLQQYVCRKQQWIRYHGWPIL
ncbi:hypothetical protein OIU84_009642 [Salix udensis]|uniref:Uncharacterized protein n=1 Tax=Salix udensis TaxID=889485 RepID=A0AAD6JTE9_9ROSI|nr:hypothetical protein OIU84_009642 [Salix udensis]